MDQRSLTAEVDDERIDFAVVIVVGEAGAARGGAHAEHGARLARDVFKMPFSHAAEQGVLLRDQVQRLTLQRKVLDSGLAEQ